MVVARWCCPDIKDSTRSVKSSLRGEITPLLPQFSQNKAKMEASHLCFEDACNSFSDQSNVSRLWPGHDNPSIKYNFGVHNLLQVAFCQNTMRKLVLKKCRNLHVKGYWWRVVSWFKWNASDRIIMNRTRYATLTVVLINLGVPIDGEVSTLGWLF